MGDQPGPRAATLDRQVGRGCLEDCLAHSARIAGPNVADHLQPGRDLLQDLGRVLAEPGQSAPVAAAAHQFGFMHHSLARQMIGQRSADGFSAGPGLSISWVWLRASCLVLGLVLLEIFEAQLQLGDLGIQPFGRLTILLASQRRQLRPQMSDFDCGSAKLGACSSQLVPQCGDLSLGRAICQVHIAILPERRPHVQHEHPHERTIPSRGDLGPRSPGGHPPINPLQQH